MEQHLEVRSSGCFLTEKINQLVYLEGAAGRPRNVYQDYVYVESFPKKKEGSIFRKQQIRLPTGIAVDTLHNVYVVDFKQNTLWKLTPNGFFDKRMMGKSLLDQFLIPGGGLTNPHGILLGSNGLLYLSDFGNNRVLVGKMDADAQKLHVIEQKNKSSEGYLLGPQGMALDEKGNLFISDTGNSCIHYYNAAGTWLYSFAKRGSSDGDLLLPSGLAFEAETGRLYVADRGEQSAQCV